MIQNIPRVYPLFGLLAGYLLVMLTNPVRLALRDGFRCIARYERIWLTFALLGFAYFVFQLVTFSSVPRPSEIDFAEIISIAKWNWSPLSDVWREVPLPTIESVAGIFDNATTTYPLSALAAILFLVNWRIASHLRARLIQTLPLVEHSDLFRFPRQYPGCAPETARLLAAAELE